MKERLKEIIRAGLATACANGSLISEELPDIQLEVPAHKQHGDFSCNVAMMMAKSQKMAPRKIAEALVEAMLAVNDGFCNKIEIAGPGFINFYLNENCWYEVLNTIAQEGENYGLSTIGEGKRVQVEFVSANPTGPLHVGHGRGAVVGDAVAELLSAIGFDVQREYYVNDAGNQVTLLGRSIWLRLKELCGEKIEFPEDGYQGDYIKEIAQELKQDPKHGGDAIASLPEEEAIILCRDFGIEAMLSRISIDLKAFGITFDRWYSEQSLYTEGLVEKELGKLKELGLTFEEEGALWLRTTDYGDDKDRVLYRSDGNPTYFASDVAYHMEKFDRGFQTVIDVWGADHHGYIPRMKAMLAGLGHRPEDLQVLMIQLVNLLRNGQPVAMGKRSGEFVTLRDVVEEVGKDACRFFFLMRRSDSSLDFDLELAKEKSSENPVYYVQYAHARVCSIEKNANEAGYQIPEVGTADYSPLTLPEELELAKHLARYPETVESAGLNHEPHRLVFYLQELAANFHSYYNKQKVVVDDTAETLARLALVDSVRTVIANGLRLLGISAPQKM